MDFRCKRSFVQCKNFVDHFEAEHIFNGVVEFFCCARVFYDKTHFTKHAKKHFTEIDSFQTSINDPNQHYLTENQILTDSTNSQTSLTSDYIPKNSKLLFIKLILQNQKLYLVCKLYENCKN
jgi:hypothetical protein